MVVHDPACLHGRVHRRRADEAEARRRGAASRARPTRASSPASRRGRRRGPAAGAWLQKSSCSGSPVARSSTRRRRVRDRSLDLPAVPDDARVGEQPLDVAPPNAATRSGSKPANASRKRRPLPQDRQPREPRLEAFEAEPLVDRRARPGPDGPTPRRGSGGTPVRRVPAATGSRLGLSQSTRRRPRRPRRAPGRSSPGR